MHQLHVDVAAATSHGFPNPYEILHLPQSCPGCGALTQAVSPGLAGFYGTNRKSVKAFLGRDGQYPGNRYDRESKVIEHVLGDADVNMLSWMGLQGASEVGSNGQTS